MHIPITLESIFLDIFLPFTIACIVNILLFYLIQLLTDPDFDELLPKTCAGKAFDDEDLVIKIEDLPYLEDKAKLEVNVENSGIQEKSKKLNTQKSNTEKYVLKHSFKNTDLKSKLLNSFKNDVARTHSWPIQQPLQQPTPTPSCSVQNSRNNSDIYLNTGVHANNSNHMPASINNSDINTSENNTCNSIQSISKFQDQQLLQTIKSRPRRLALSSNNPRQTLLLSIFFIACLYTKISVIVFFIVLFVLDVLRRTLSQPFICLSVTNASEICISANCVHILSDIFYTVKN